MLTLPDGYYLDPDLYPHDTGAYVTHLAAAEIGQNTLHIPQPYAAADAKHWFAEVQRRRIAFGKPIHYALRRADGWLVGAVGFANYDTAQPHRIEIGYWLAKPLWGRGIMPGAVRAMCHRATHTMGIVRVAAHVLAHNHQSQRVLEKSGFIYEGVLRQFHCKNGVLLDSHVWAWINPTNPHVPSTTH